MMSKSTKAIFSKIRPKLVSASTMAIAAFMNSYPKKRIRAFGFLICQEHLEFCFDTTKNYRHNLDFIRETLEFGAMRCRVKFSDLPLENIGTFAYKSFEEDVYNFYVRSEYPDFNVNEDLAEFRKCWTESLKDLWRADAFFTLKTTEDFLICYQFIWDPFTTVVPINDLTFSRKRLPSAIANLKLKGQA